MSPKGRRDTDFGIEQQIFLGGKISTQHEEYKFFARMTSETAKAYTFIKNFDEWKKLDPKELLLKLIELDGQIDAMKEWTELTKLSAILGDFRKKGTAKKLRDQINKRLNQ